jgi:superfamily II RNA helicase
MDKNVDPCASSSPGSYYSIFIKLIYILSYNISMIYDQFQEEAIAHINQGFSVIVCAPTGAGKTAIAEHIISTSIQNNIGVIYTAPIKALSNQKFRDFQNQFGQAIGILTGDISINPQAPILIMTTEIFRNKILDDPESLKKYSWVIFDEIHYLDHPERGTVWEESLIFLPDHMKLLGLSATIPNIGPFASWIESIHHKPVKVVIQEKRPVPLHFFFQNKNEVWDSIENVKNLSVARPNRLDALINYLRAKDGLPAIYFVFGRKRAEELAFELRSFDFLNSGEKKEITSLYDTLCSRFDLKDEFTAGALRPLIEKGIGYHHAGLLPTLKEVIERLFTSRLLKVIFTTETFALGINMPSRSVIFDNLTKFYGRYARLLKTRDFYQMAGRAGRRGLDTEGFVYCRINLHQINLQEIRRVILSKPEEVKSRLNTSYATLLNLYEKYQDELLNIYPRSFHYFQSRKNEQKEALRLFQAKLKLLQDHMFIQNKVLTNKGKFAKVLYGYELLLSELYDHGLLEKFDATELGVVTLSMVFAPRKNQRPTADLSKASRRLKKICEDIHGQIKHKEQKYKIYPVTKAPYFHLSASLEAWMKKESFDKILRLTDTDEGEVVRYFRMSVAVLREIHEASASSSLLKEKTKEAIRAINRDIVDAEKQLREG